jgi:predicted TIM-barrel fold metal-dependent hydrolase
MPGAVDIEQHLVPPALLSACQAAPPGTPGGLLAKALEAVDEDRLLDLDHHLAGMDACGVATALLSFPLLPGYGSGDRSRIELVSRCNDELLGAAQAHPSRFGVLFALPLPFADACLAEIDRLAAEPGVRGAIAHTAIDDWTVDEGSLEAVYARLAERRLPLLLHPASSHFGGVPSFADWALDSAIGTMVETSVAAARLILSGTLDRVPDLDLIVPHLGGVLPYLSQRIADTSGRGEAAQNFTDYVAERLYMDSCSFHPPALAAAVETASASRILLASDFPYRGAIARAVADIGDSPLSVAEKEAILSGNAVRLRLA